jgi:hypothetical protein
VKPKQTVSATTSTRRSICGTKGGRIAARRSPWRFGFKHQLSDGEQAARVKLERLWNGEKGE